LEEKAQAKGEFALYDTWENEITDYEFIRKPEQYKPGLARLLPDGTEKEVEFEGADVVIIFEDGGKREDKLIWRLREPEVIFIHDTPRPPDDTKVLILPPGLKESDI
jgi:hypothetical protein